MPTWLLVTVMLVLFVFGVLLVRHVAKFIQFKNSFKRLTLYFCKDLNKWHTYEEIQKGSQVEGFMLGWLLYNLYNDGVIFRQLDEQQQHVKTVAEVAESSEPAEVVLAHHFVYKPNPPQLKTIEEYFRKI